MAIVGQSAQPIIMLGIALGEDYGPAMAATLDLPFSMSDFGAPVVNPTALAPWRAPLARALHRNRSKPYSRYVQLATLAANGRPTNRTVVFRGFYGHHNALIFVTDGRSGKVSDLSQSPWGELCWYFTQTREQFRLSGSITLASATTVDPLLAQARQHQWDGLSAASRQSFHWPEPGAPRSDDPMAFATSQETVPCPTPPASFCLGLFWPDGVDHLELRGDPQTRTQYHALANGTWRTQAVNP